MDITFNTIMPFIRYAQTITVSSSRQYTNATAYDNRIFLCLEGSGNTVISDTYYPLQRGSIIMWKANTQYRFEPSDNTVFKLVGFNFDFTNISSHKTIPIPPAKQSPFNKKLICEDVNFTDLVQFNEPFLIHQMLNLKSSFLKIKDEYTHKKIYYSNRCSALFLDILSVLARMSTISPAPVKRINAADEIINYIQENYNKEISSETLAHIFGYHQGYISRLIRNATGMSTHQYLINYRIDRAIDYLQQEKLSVSQVCYLCGFYDLPHFSKCFKARTGKTPSEYLK